MNRLQMKSTKTKSRQSQSVAVSRSDVLVKPLFATSRLCACVEKLPPMAFPIRLVTMGRAGRTSWPATRMAAVYLLVVCLMVWILPLFPAQPKLAPIFNPVTHMVPPPFPLLLIFPALAFGAAPAKQTSGTSNSATMGLLR
jgi:hypothetical protein